MEDLEKRVAELEDRVTMLGYRISVMENRDPVLEMQNVEKHFGGVHAIDNFSVKIEQGQIHGLIGPNGAGKTTIFNNITGIYAPDAGKILFRGYDITGSSPHRVAQLGIGRTFQNIRLFSGMTVFENVLTAMHLRRKSNFLVQTLRLNGAEDRAMREKAVRLLETVGLLDVADEMATSLPYGKQRLLEIARALATEPKLLLLDEPAAGMNPQETEDLSRFIVDIKNRFGLTVFVIEHHMQLVMAISDRIYVIDFGKQIAEGTPQEIQNDPVVIEAYLGGSEDDDEEVTIG